MKILLLFLAVLAVAFADVRFAVKARPVNYSPYRSVADAVAFLKGFAIGLGTELGNPEACAKDITNMTADFTVAFA